MVEEVGVGGRENYLKGIVSLWRSRDGDERRARQACMREGYVPVAPPRHNHRRPPVVAACWRLGDDEDEVEEGLSGAGS